MASAQQINIEHIPRLGVLLQKPKRIKILVGGRASTKSTFVADHCLERVTSGEVWCCAREYQNSIDDSVHSMLTDEIQRLKFPGFNTLKSEISHTSTGRVFYRGLARNITSLKGLNCHNLWIEEGESLSAATLRIVTASVRVSALEQQQAKEEGREIRIPQIWITMNRGASKDPIAQRFLKRADNELLKCGYYEDDLVMIIDVNYNENPWFVGSGLEPERSDDKKYLSTAAYNHKWHGHYSDTVENAIIEPEWFDACIDAHEKLDFKPEGLEVVAHDPFDGGEDAAALAHRYGSVIVECLEKKEGKVNDVCDWSLDYTQNHKPDAYIWDGGGIGAGLKRQIADALDAKNINVQMFEGQAAVKNPNAIYEPTVGVIMQAKTNREAFLNRRAQRYWELRDRIFRTYLAVTQGKYTDPSKMISFSSKIGAMPVLRSEICRIPRKTNGMGKIQIMSKPEMKKEGIDSPNMADCVMMSLDVEEIAVDSEEIIYTGSGR